MTDATDQRHDAEERRWHARGVVVALMGIACTILLAAGGWVWSLSAEAAHETEMDKRVTTVELRDGEREKQLNGVSERLARMEAMLTYLVRLKQAP